jgi:hypothetical protein
MEIKAIYLFFLQDCQAPVDHNAKNINTGCIGSLNQRAVSEFNPKASLCSTNWAIFPGKTATKNAATIQPTFVRCE